jgi:hypothetical protein
MFNIYKNNELIKSDVSWDDVITALNCTDEDVLSALDGYDIGEYQLEITTDLMDTVAMQSVIEIEKPSDKIKQIAELMQVSDNFIQKTMREFKNKLESAGMTKQFISLYTQIGEVRRCL